MNGFPKTALFGIMLLIAAASTGPSRAQSADPAWLDALRMQLEMDEACEVNYFINMREGRIGTNDYFEARVQCVDGRMFDASRTEPEKTFLIRPCGRAVC